MLRIALLALLLPLAAEAPRAEVPDPRAALQESRAAEASPAEISRALEGHESDARCVAFSPDGTRIASGGFDRTVRIWDAGSGVPIAVLEGHAGRVLSVAWSPDGRLVGSASDDGTVRIWGLPGDGATRIAAGGGEATRIATSADLRWLAGAESGGKVWLRDATASREALSFAVAPGVTSLALSPDARTLALGAKDGAVSLRDVSGATAPPAPSAGSAVEILGVGATWRYRKGVEKPPEGWSAPDFDDSAWERGGAGFGYSSNPAELETVRTRLDDMARTGYLTLFARASLDIEDPGLVEKATLRVLVDDGFVAWMNGEEVGRKNVDGARPAHDAPASSAMEPTYVEVDLGPRVKAGRNVLAVEGHNINRTSSDFVLTPTVSAVFRKPPEGASAPGIRAVADLRGGTGAVLCFAWSPDGKTLAAGAADGVVLVRQDAPGATAMRGLAPKGAVHGLAFVSDRVLAIACDDARILLRDLAKAEEPDGALEGHTGPVLALAANSDRTRLLSGGSDGTVRLWDVEGRLELRCLRGHADAVCAVAFGADPRRVVSGGPDGTLRVWNVESGAEDRRLATGGPVTVVGAGPSGRFFSGRPAGDVVEWRPVSTEARVTLSGHDGPVQRLAFSPKGGELASVGTDGTVRIWSDSGGQKRSLGGHDGGAYAIAWSPDGAVLATGGMGPEVKVWDPGTGELRHRLEGRGDATFALAFSRDGKRLLGAGTDGTVLVWSLDDGKLVASLPGHAGWVCALATVSGESRIASLDLDGNLLVRDFAGATATRRARLPCVTYDLAASPDGRTLAAATLPGKVLIIPVR